MKHYLLKWYPNKIINTYLQTTSCILLDWVYVKHLSKYLDQNIFFHVTNNNLSVLKFLVKHGANIHIYNNLALRWASSKGYSDIVKFLLKYGANIHEYDDTSLWLASANNHLSVVKILVKHGANIHADNDYALRSASKSGNLSIVKFLLKHGADIHACNDDALIWARYQDYHHIINFIKSLPKTASITDIKTS